MSSIVRHSLRPNVAQKWSLVGGQQPMVIW